MQKSNECVTSRGGFKEHIQIPLNKQTTLLSRVFYQLFVFFKRIVQILQMRQLFEINLSLKDGPVASTTFSLNKIIEGRITIKPLQRIQVDYIGYHLIAIEQKESISLGVLDDIIPDKHTEKFLSTKYLVQNSLLSEFEPYKYKIRFINNEVETYSGINTNFSVKLQVFIKINTKAAKATTTFLTQLNPATKLPKRGIYKESFFLTFGIKPYTYQLISKQANLVVAVNNPLWNGFIIALGILFFFGAATNSILIPAILAFIVGIIALVYYYRYTLLGDFIIDYEQVDNKVFLFKINSDNWRYVKEIAVHYKIQEKVIFPGSETDDTRIALLHGSQKQTFKNQNTSLLVKNEFPKNDELGTTTIGTTTIYWVALITLHTSWGFDLPFEHQFVVKKKIKNINS